MWRASSGVSEPALGSSWLLLVLHDVGTGPAEDRVAWNFRAVNTRTRH
jgi:hypothetical protein